MDKALISSCKDFINNGDLEGLKLYYKELQNMEYDFVPNWQYIYRQLYIHSCLKKKKDIADWFIDIFPSFDVVSQIALRHIPIRYPRFKVLGLNVLLFCVWR